MDIIEKQLNNMKHLTSWKSGEITPSMKIKCIGAFYVEREVGCTECKDMTEEEHEELPWDNCGICHGQGCYTETTTVPWMMMKDIFAMMSAAKREDLESGNI